MLLFLLACFSTGPTFATKADVDKALGRGDFATACAGLTQKDGETRRYTAEKLKDLDQSAANCTCDHLTFEGKWDAEVLTGLQGTTKDERAGCAGTLLDDTAQQDRTGLVTKLLSIKAPQVRARLAQAATSDADPAVKAAAVPVFSHTKDAGELKILTDGLSNPDPAWAAAAATVLSGRSEAADALRTAASSHPDSSVRIAALTSYAAVRAEDFPSVVCKAMMEDSAGDVRAAAIRIVKPSRNADVMACLRKRALTEEADPVVRLALLDTLKVAPDPAAADILCDAMPFWVKTYVKDAAVEAHSDLDIAYYQNERFYDDTYRCLEAAVKAGGYSCWGRAYLGASFREAGGKVSYPDCSGKGGRKAASNEISFGE